MHGYDRHDGPPERRRTCEVCERHRFDVCFRECGLLLCNRCNDEAEPVTQFQE